MSCTSLEVAVVAAVAIVVVAGEAVVVAVSHNVVIAVEAAAEFVDVCGSPVLIADEVCADSQ